jgi:hypothetical protein
MLGIQAVTYEAGRAGTEKLRRAPCLEALVEDAAKHDQAKIVFDLDDSLRIWDRQQMIELTRAAGVMDRIADEHRTRYPEDHRCRGQAGLAVEAPGQLQAALATQVDVEQGDVRSQLPGPLERVGAVGGHTHDRDALAFQEAAGGVQDAGAVVDNEAAQHHGLRILGRGAGAHAG